MRTPLLLGLGAATLITACGPGFSPAYKVEKPRVIGGFVSVDSDPLRATPAPGETATFTLVTGDHGPKTGRTFMLVACRQSTSNFDIVYCDDPSTFLGTNFVTTLPGEADPKPDPSLQFTVPDESEIGEDTEVWVFGVVCNGGTVRDLLTDPPQIGTEWDPCEPAPEGVEPPYGQIVSTRLPLARDANSTNRRPSLGTLQFDEVDWTQTAPDDAPITGCLGMGYPEIQADYAPKLDESLRAIVGTALPDDRETYYDDFLQETVVEDLFLRFYVSAGKLDATYDAIDDGDDLAIVRYRPLPADEVDPTGTLVRFTLYMEDSRHASSWYRRAVCVVP